ncbi:hypothetical protein FPV67DRAFT_1666212 [Lyophyllum atratum]|nr:hypothetical protein FPV67DRAFT_1666212 [Lyophyllum atratum]
MPAVLSTALSFVPAGSLRELEATIRDPFLKTLFQGTIGSSIYNYRYNPIDIINHLDLGVTTYSLDRQIATSLWLVLKKLAQVIHCAALNHNPFETNRPLPLTIPIAQLRALRVSAPHISLVLAFPDQNPLSDRFSTIEELRDRIELVQHIAAYYVRWIGRGIQRSVEKGVGSTWNWGAMWGMGWLEFLGRLETPGLVREAGMPEYDGHAVDNSLSVILHPSRSFAAAYSQAMATRTDDIMNGRIPIQDGQITVNVPFAPYYAYIDKTSYLFLD